MIAVRRVSLAFALLALAVPAGAAPSAAWTLKVDPWVLERLSLEGGAEMLVVLADQADLSGAAALHGKKARGQFVFEQLTAAAERSQKPVLELLKQRRLPHRAYWIANMIWLRADAPTVEMLALRNDVLRISANPSVRGEIPELEPSQPGAVPTAPAAVEASLTHVGAPTLWAAGISGGTVVVAGADTGYQWDHPALKNQYRGWNGLAASHAYNWHDAIHTTGSVCGADSAVPCDDNNHGTHTMGTMVGNDGAANQIGMAPGARWIGCRNMDRGNGTPTTYAECFQFFLAPTDAAGQNPNPDLAPDVINNSWGCPVSEGCSDPLVLQTVVENVRAAGIVPVVSAGNSGSGCSTVNTPAATYDAAFSVGATDNSDVIASFSSRGTVTVDGSGRLKPDISAPGVSIRSSVRNNGYSSSSGTSMAGPHVAGLVALLISGAPCLRGDVDAIEQLIIATAVPRTSAQTCGGILGSDVPNAVYGHGAIRAVVPDPAAVCGLVFQDGFETGNVVRWNGTP